MIDDPIEVFASLRPADDVLDDEARADLWARVVGPGGTTVVPPVAGLDDAADERPGGDAGRRRRIVAVALAAVVVVVGLMVATNRSSNLSERGVGRPDLGSPVPTELASTAAVTVDPGRVPSTPPPFTNVPAGQVTASDVPWYLPTWLPDGVDVWVANARVLGDQLLPARIGSRWVRRAPDGRTVKAVLAVQASRAGTEPAPGATGDRTVHGVPVAMSQLGRDGTYVYLTWVERGYEWNLIGAGVGADDLIRIADESTVGNGELTLAGGTGFEPVAVPSGPPATITMGSSLTAGRYAKGRLAQWVNVTVMAARKDDTLDGNVGVETRRDTLDGIERSVVDNPADEPQLAHKVQWFAGGYLITVRVRAPLDRVSLDRLVTGLRVATPSDVGGVYDEVNRRGSVEPTIDEATTPDGTVLSVRGRDGGVRYLCAAKGEATRCVVGSSTEVQGDVGAGDLAPTRVLVGDRAMVVGWRTGAGGAGGAGGAAPTAPGQDRLADVPGPHGVFRYATKAVGERDPLFPSPSGDAWDEFWGTPALVPSPADVPSSSSDASG